MENTWILVANGSRARMFVTSVPRKMDADQDLVEVACFEHPESREKLSELLSDVYGHQAHSAGRDLGQGSGSGDFIEKNNVRDNEKIIFARELVEAIAEGYKKKLFSRLVLVLPAAFYGQMLPLLPAAIQKHVLLHIAKDYSNLTQHPLRVQLAEHLNLD